jgi:hypothetical protein
MRLISPKRWRRIITIALAGLLFTHPIISFSGNTNAGADTLLAVLQPEDAVPGDALKLKEVSLNGNSYSMDCSYYELLQQAENMAAVSGANLLKINKRTTHSRSQPCDGLKVTFYRSPEPRKAEQSFRWHADRPLTWDDFTGPVRTASGDHTAAETNCGIAVETSLAPSGGKAKVYVFNTFDKRSSWVREGKDLPAVLEHEQGHWDLCELYTRKMQARFDSEDITGAVLSRKVNEIYNEVSREYMQRQEQYEQDTQHGIIAEAQQRWTKLISGELGRVMTERL